jgi:hypothetical protein
MIQVGDRVLYVPHECHALEANANGEYPWEMEYTHPNGKKEILVGERIPQVIAAIKRFPDPSEERKKLKFLYPCKTWSATVTAVHENGTVSLDVQSNNGGVTLQYDNIPLDEVQKNPHTCHKEG